MTLQYARHLESYNKAYEKLAEVLKKLPREMWSFKPSPRQPSVQEIVAHLTDQEGNHYLQCRQLGRQPGTVPDMGTEQWVRKLNIVQQEADYNLEVFNLLRVMTHQLIQNLPVDCWQATVEHPAFGSLTFEQWLETSEKHFALQLEQMQQNYQLWREKATGAPGRN